MVNIEEVKVHLCKFMNIGIYDTDKSYLTIHVKANVIAHLYTDGNKVILREFAYRRGHPHYASDQEDIQYLLSKLVYRRIVSVGPNYTVPILLDEILGLVDD